MKLHSGAQHLHHQKLPVAIDHQTRQPVRFRKNQAAPPFGVVVPEKPAELDRPANLPSEKGVVDRFVFIEAPDPGDQLRIGRPGGAGEKTAAAVDGSGTPGQFSNGAGKNPGVTAAQRLLAPGMKFQNKLTHNTSSLRTT